MALRAVPEHPKFAGLKSRLGLTKFQTLGLLEALWHFTGRFASRGNVGKFTDDEIEAWLDWQGEPGKAVEALTQSGWLDPHPEYRLIVHDWQEHADAATKLSVKRSGKGFVTTVSRQCPNKVEECRTELGLPVPEPVPEPEAGAVPEPRMSASGLPIFEVPMPALVFDAGMVSRGVLTECGLAGMRLSTVIADVATSEISRGADGEQLVGRMVESWREYEKSRGRLQITVGAEKFFGEGHWRDSSSWPWRGGNGSNQNNSGNRGDRVSRQIRELEKAGVGFSPRHTQDGSGQDGGSTGRRDDRGDAGVVLEGTR